MEGQSKGKFEGCLLTLMSYVCTDQAHAAPHSSARASQVCARPIILTGRHAAQAQAGVPTSATVLSLSSCRRVLQLVVCRAQPQHLAVLQGPSAALTRHAAAGKAESDGAAACAAVNAAAAAPLAPVAAAALPGRSGQTSCRRQARCCWHEADHLRLLLRRQCDKHQDMGIRHASEL